MRKKSNRVLFQKRVLEAFILITAFVTIMILPQTVQAGAENTEGKIIKLQLVTYNVAVGQWTTPEQVAEALKPLNPDIVFLNEVPKANAGKDVKDWSARVAEGLGLEHVYVGSISSANHKAPKWGDVSGNYGGKFKSVLSRTPLTNSRDYKLQGMGWSPAGIVRAETKIGGRKFALYSLHLPGRTGNWSKSTQKKLAELIDKEDASFDILAAGDFNEETDSVVLRNLLLTGNLKNAIPMPTTEYLNYCSEHGFYLTNIDHTLYSIRTPVKVLKSKVDWGPKIETQLNKKTQGHLSDHPWVWCELVMPAKNSYE